jgi:hypothetical protein
VSDPGASLGWRAARGWGTIADAADRQGRDRPLCVLLLPVALEAFELRERAEDLLTAPGAVAVDPPRLSYSATRRLGEAVADGLAGVQARRMRLPGFPRALVVFDALQYPLARALTALHPDAELWYGPAPHGSGPLHDLASERAALRFEDGEGPAHTQNLPLWERMEALGIESGRLGSERADVR